jgi:hypothetical protein
MSNSPETITGNEAFWGISMQGHIPPDVLDTINKSKTLVSELLAYGAAVAKGDGKIVPMSTDLGNGNILKFTGSNISFGYNWTTWTPEQFVGNLSHEIGHFINYAADSDFINSLNINPNDPNAAALYSMAGTRFEGEAVLNNFKIQQEIKGNGGAGSQLININGNVDSGGKLQSTLDSLHAADVANGLSQTQDDNALAEAGGQIFSANHPSGANRDETYAEYYGKNGNEIFTQMGFIHSSTPNLPFIPLPLTLPGAVDNVSFSDLSLDGNFSTVTEALSSGGTDKLYFTGSILSSELLEDQFGNVISSTTYSHGTNGAYVANMYDSDGHATGQDQFHSDGSMVAYQFNSNGTQNATVLDANGHETEYATFNTSGTKTQDLFYDATTGHLTQENDFNADGSQTDHIINSDGTQNAIVYNAGGHETEYATFGTNGIKTQDLFYDATTGHLTQENDFNADGSQTDHIINSKGTQNSIVFDANGHETEYATFGTNGIKTQDLFYDATTGHLTRENDFNADGSQTDHIINSDGTQNSVVFNASGHETEYASFNASGVKTQDLFYNATTGQLTQENDFNADGSQIDRVYNTNGTQTATVFNAGGHETEQATFDASGKISKDLVFDGKSGAELQETDYNANGSGVAHIFNPDGTQNAAVFDPSGHISEYATYGTNGKLATDIFYDANGHATQYNEYTSNQTTVHQFNADNTQTATVYNAAGQETEFAKFDTNGHKTDDYFFNGPTGRETQYDSYGSDGSMVEHLFNSDNSQDAIIYDASGRETQYDAFNSQGQLTGFTDFTYTVGGGYDALAYGPTGFETGWADYNGSGSLISSSGGQYNFSLDDSYGEGSGDWDFSAPVYDDGYASDFGFYY